MKPRGCRKLPVVIRHDLPTPTGEHGKPRHLGCTQRRLDVADAVVVSQLKLLVVPIAFDGIAHERTIPRDAVLGEQRDARRQFGVVRADRTSLARRHRFDRMEAEAGEVCGGADPPPRARRADGMGGILYEHKPELIANGADGIVVYGDASEVNRHNRLGFGRDLRPHRFGRHVPRSRIDVGEHGSAAAVQHAIG